MFEWITVLVIVLSYILFLLCCTDYRANKNLIIILGVVSSIFISMIAYYTIPAMADDLTRYYDQINMMRGESLEYAFRYGTYSVNIISNLLFFLVSRGEINELLPAIVMFVETGIIMSIIYKFNKEGGYKVRSLVLGLVSYFGVCALYISISGIRFMLGITLGAILLYIDLQEGKKNFWLKIGYVILPLMHTSLLLIIIFRLLLIKSTWIKKYKYIFILSPIWIVLGAGIIKKIPIYIFQVTYERVFMYMGYNDIAESTLRSIGYIFYTIVIIYVIRVIPKIEFQKIKEEYLTLIEIICIIIIPNLVGIKSIYFRFISLVAILMLPVFIEFFSKSKNTYKNILVKFIWCISMLIFYIYQIVLYSHWTIQWRGL